MIAWFEWIRWCIHRVYESIIFKSQMSEPWHHFDNKFCDQCFCISKFTVIVWYPIYNRSYPVSIWMFVCVSMTQQFFVRSTIRQLWTIVTWILTIFFLLSCILPLLYRRYTLVWIFVCSLSCETSCKAILQTLATPSWCPKQLPVHGKTSGASSSNMEVSMCCSLLYPQPAASLHFGSHEIYLFFSDLTRQ